MNISDRIKQLFGSKDKEDRQVARQLMFIKTPLSRLVELYLYHNEGGQQSLSNFPMKRQIYDYLPNRLLLKCSRKTLKSTLLSNVIALNMVRYNYYKHLYIAPLEATTKLFSGGYLDPRFQSPPLRKIITRWDKNDVFEKILSDTKSAVLLKYASDDASRTRGPAVDHNIFDEVQDINSDVIPIVEETMSMSPFKRTYFAGTPLTRTNTIHCMWNKTNRLEWTMKCEGCNHWNALIEDNDPLKMIQRQGLSCSKCGKKLNSRNGLWVSHNPIVKDFIGYHLAQPILPHYNETDKEWKKIYDKVHGGNLAGYQIFNEVFGLAFDVGKKPITEEELRAVCRLGPMRGEGGKLLAYESGRKDYRFFTCGVDWGVNMTSSRTTVCLGAMRSDGVYEVFYLKTFHDFEYEQHIREIAEIANSVGAFCASDSGPDPMRGIALLKMTSPKRTQLVRYDHGKFIQHSDIPKQAIDPSQNRWCLHRSDTLSLTFKMLKAGKILFPRWEDSAECLSDILNVEIEVKDGILRQDLFYRHSPDLPDDFIHALNFAYCQALMVLGDPLLTGPSTNAGDLPD